MYLFFTIIAFTGRVDQKITVHTLIPPCVIHLRPWTHLWKHRHILPLLRTTRKKHSVIVPLKLTGYKQQWSINCQHRLYHHVLSEQYI